jgi:hypothetical protein
LVWRDAAFGAEIEVNLVFDNPSFTFWNVVYTAIGAAVLWGTWGRTKLKALVLSNIIRLFLSGRTEAVVEFLIFVILGTLVGIGLVKPVNPEQAITAGLAWTGVFARPDYESSRK